MKLLLKKIREALSPKVVWEGESKISGLIKVIEDHNIRRLMVNGYTQSRSLQTDHLTHGYWDGFIRKRPIRKVLLLGLGAGTAVKLLNYWNKPQEIVAVELDSQIINIAQNYFSLNDPNLKIINGDAYQEVKKLLNPPAGQKEKFDLIIVDLYVGGENAEEENQEEFYSSLKKLLSKGGEVAVNRIFHEENVHYFKEIMSSNFLKVESQVLSNSYSPNNIIIILKT